MRKVAFLTDVEGRWDKVLDFCAGAASLVTYDEATGLRVADDALFVFGGDAIDRGPAGRKIMATLLDAKRRQPDRVVLLAGNRDINKIRLVRELDGQPHPRGALLRDIFTNTMGASAAFEHRRTELIAEGRARTEDEDVVDSWLEDLTPNGPLAQYLAATVLAHREEETLFLHGGVTAENLGVVPGRSEPIKTDRDIVDAWARALNDFYVDSIDAFIANRSDANGTSLWQKVIEYQAPIGDTRFNQASVVYARSSDEIGNPMLPAQHIIEALLASSVRRVVVGHTPSGDCPALVRDPTSGFELVLADNSYGRVERGSRVTIDARNIVHVEGTTILDSGEREDVVCDLLPPTSSNDNDNNGVLGLRDETSGRLVKAKLARGDYLTFRGLEGRRVEQIAMTEAELRSTSLVAPSRRV